MRSLLLISSLLAAPALAQNAQGDVSVTIYNDNLALVQDTRQMAIPAGRSRQEFPNVSGQISPETVTLSAPDVAIVEQNFDFDLLSPAKLMEKAVGEMITLVRTNPATGAEERERARVLSVVLERPRAGTRPVTLSYLTPGMSWKADYVTLFDEAAGTIDVQGWVTLTNTTGTTFENADTLLIAGNVQQEQGPSYGRGYRPPPPPPPPGNRPGMETAERESLGDFYLYPLPERTTIANQQTKQVSFLDVTGAAARRAYVYRNGWLQTRDRAESADSVLQFSSSRNAGLGDALPAGTVRVYMKDARGQAQFVGENSIGHTPMGSDIAIRTGEAFDVKVQPVLVERREMPGRRWRTTMRYTLTNATPEPVTVDLIQAGLWGETRIVDESQESTRRSADETLWRVNVPANGEAMVTATFDTEY